MMWPNGRKLNLKVAIDYQDAINARCSDDFIIGWSPNVEHNNKIFLYKCRGYLENSKYKITNSNCENVLNATRFYEGQLAGLLHYWTV